MADGRPVRLERYRLGGWRVRVKADDAELLLVGDRLAQLRPRVERALVAGGVVEDREAAGELWDAGRAAYFVSERKARAMREATRGRLARGFPRWDD